MPFSSEYIYTIFNNELKSRNIEHLTLEIAKEVIEKSFKNAVVNQSGNFLHIKLDDSN